MMLFPQSLVPESCPYDLSETLLLDLNDEQDLRIMRSAVADGREVYSLVNRFGTNYLQHGLLKSNVLGYCALPTGVAVLIPLNDDKPVAPARLPDEAYFQSDDPYAANFHEDVLAVAGEEAHYLRVA
jgi:hypothetical protein